MAEGPCRWGILGTAGIARKNWKAIWNAENATLTAVGSRDVSRSGQFIAECQSQAPFAAAPRAIGSYEELIEADDVDAIYLPLPTGIRKEWVVRAAEAGKHVLVEKPCGTTAADVSDMLTACSANNVQFMDGVMFMHSRRLSRMEQALDQGNAIGKLRRITSHHCFCAPDDFLRSNIRVHSQLEPHGCLGDLGWYNIRLTLWAQGWKLPERVIGRILTESGRPDSPEPVPLEFSAELFFGDGVTAHFYCSFITENQQWANLGGTEGFLALRDYVLPFAGGQLDFDVTNAYYDITGCDFQMQPRTQRQWVTEYANSAANSQETNMIRTFSRLAQSQSPDPHWGTIALRTQMVLDACLLSAREGSQVVEVAERAD